MSSVTVLSFTDCADTESVSSVMSRRTTIRLVALILFMLSVVIG